jgi:hypothetical protein
MKIRLLYTAVVAIALSALAPAMFAQLNIPSDGSDGALIITSNTVIDLAQAVTKSWDANNAANAGKGIYDSNKWAVVFKYSSVVVSNGATVTFANHPSRAPVVWLVSGDVAINGILSLNGQNYQGPPALAEPGPGGFRGGASYYAPGVSSSAGFGPGGGGIQNNAGYAGSYGSVGSSGSTTYGNPSLLPLIGGSGGGGDGDGYTDWQVTGAAGGGAMLIAAAQTISVSGTIRANGGAGYDGSSRNTGGGSGGGIRLVASTLAGAGVVQAIGGTGWAAGGLGRIRIERVTNTATVQVTPDPSIVPLQAGATPLIWLPTDGPTATVVSIGGSGAPPDPRASFGTYGPDVTISLVSTTQVVVVTTNAESASTVKVRVTPRASGNYTETTATCTATNSTNPLVLLWTATVPVNPGYSAVQARVVRP